jgi:hypothetical protein
LARLRRFTRIAAEGVERDAERRTTSGVCVVCTVSTKPSAPRDALSASVRWAALLTLSRTRIRSFPTGSSRRGRGPRGKHALYPRSTPTAGGLPNDGSPRTARVTPARLSPLDRPPPPHRSLALRPFRCGEVRSGYGRFQRRGDVTLVISQGVEEVGVFGAVGGDGRRPIPRTRTLSRGEREGPIALQWEGEGVRRPTACRQGVRVKSDRVKPLTLPPPPAAGPSLSP